MTLLPGNRNIVLAVQEFKNSKYNLDKNQPKYKNRLPTDQLVPMKLYYRDTLTLQEYRFLSYILWNGCPLYFNI